VSVQSVTQELRSQELQEFRRRELVSVSVPVLTLHKP
jgi:hypothetical protein